MLFINLNISADWLYQRQAASQHTHIGRSSFQACPHPPATQLRLSQVNKYPHRELTMFSFSLLFNKVLPNLSFQLITWVLQLLRMESSATKPPGGQGGGIEPSFNGPRELQQPPVYHFGPSQLASNQLSQQLSTEESSIYPHESFSQRISAPSMSPQLSSQSTIYSPDSVSHRVPAKSMFP